MSESLLTRSLSVLLGACLMPTLAGCDTQSSAPPQGEAQSAERAAPETQSEGQGAYRIDRSRAGEAMSATPVRAPDGSMRPLTSLTGRPVILNLWATWCAPCVVELPTLEALAARIGEDGSVILLAQDLGDAAIPSAFLADRNIRSPQDWHDPDNEVGLAAGGNLPTTILFGRDGKEVLRVIGPLDWAGAEATALLREVGL